MITLSLLSSKIQAIFVVFLPGSREVSLFTLGYFLAEQNTSGKKVDANLSTNSSKFARQYSSVEVAPPDAPQ